MTSYTSTQLRFINAYKNCTLADLPTREYYYTTNTHRVMNLLFDLLIIELLEVDIHSE